MDIVSEDYILIYPSHPFYYYLKDNYEDNRVRIKDCKDGEGAKLMFLIKKSDVEKCVSHATSAYEIYEIPKEYDDIDEFKEACLTYKVVSSELKRIKSSW